MACKGLNWFRLTKPCLISVTIPYTNSVLFFSDILLLFKYFIFTLKFVWTVMFSWCKVRHTGRNGVWRVTMPISGFTPHYDWTSVDHIVDRRRPCDADVMGDWQGRTATGALSVCDMVPTTPTFSELATFGGVNESFYAHQQWTRCRSGGLQEIPLGLHDRSQKNAIIPTLPCMPITTYHHQISIVQWTQTFQCYYG